MKEDSAPAPAAPLLVVCDRCREEGLAGEDPFEAFGDLLDFDPVPRRKVRADGWDAETQRAFIVILSVTGSARQAARAVGKAQYGVDQLLKSPGSEGFRAAMEKAMAMAGDERSRRLAEGLRAVAAEQAGWRPPDPPWARAASRAGRVQARATFPAPEPPGAAEAEEKLKLELLGILVRQYVLKLEAERRCRLEGRIAEADFYVRQVTALEVSLDVVSGNGMVVLRDARRGGYDLLEIAETEMSKLLDRARRDHWAACGDPPRPEYPPRHLLTQHDGFATECMPAAWGGLEESPEEQWQKMKEQYARDAEDQVRWEAEARRDYERRRDSDAANNQEPGSAGQPAPERRQD